MKTVEDFLRNIFSEANWDYGELEEFDSDITDTIKEKTKLFIQEAIKADRINLLNYAKSNENSSDYGTGEISIDEKFIINTPNIELN